MAVSDILEIGRQGMQAHQKSLQVTSHNVANVNTPGYSRQKAVLETRPQSFLGQTLTGGGVEVNKVIRIHDDFILKQIYDESKFMGSYRSQADVLRQAESTVSERGSIVGSLMTQFFNDYRQLSLNPEMPTMRTAVQATGKQLVDGIHAMDHSLGKLQHDLHVRIENTLTDVNAMAKELADLNQKILDLRMRNQFNGDFEDRRDVLLKDLSEKLGFERFTSERGDINLMIPGVGILVQGGEANEFYAVRTPADGKKADGTADIYLKERNASHKVSQVITGGELGGLLQVRDNVIGGAQKHLDEIVYRFSKAVNATHAQGVGLDGVEGRAFFSDPIEVGRSAETISLDSSILANAENIAAGFESSVGDNRIALMIADLQGASMMPDVSAQGLGIEDRYNLNESLNFLTGAVAHETRRTEDLMSQQQHLMDQLENYRQSVSGVSLEEEAINLMQFQTAFNASAKALKVGDELLETILSLKD